MSLRQLTRLLTNRNATASWGDSIADSYNLVFGIVVVLAILWAPLQRASSAPASTAPFQLEPVWLVVSGCAWVLALVVAAMSRIGPVALTRAQSQWWLPSLERRSHLLRPVLIVRWAIAMGFGAVLGLALSGGFGEASWVSVLTGACVAQTLVSLLVALQPARYEARWVDVPVFVIPIVGAAIAGVGVPAPGSNPLELPAVLVVAVALALVSGVAGWRAVPLIHDGDLVRSARTSGDLGAAVLELNARGLARALERPPRRADRRSRAFRRVIGPRSAIVAADAALFVRSTRHLAQIAVAIAGTVIIVSLTAYSPIVVAFAIAALGYTGALATAEGSRRAQLTPALDALLPLPPVAVRCVRLIVPSAVMALVGTAMMALIGMRVGGPMSFALLGLAGAPAWAAGVLRAAYREQKQLSGAIVPTPMGAFPADVFEVFGTGLDLALLTLLPTFTAILISTATWQLVAAQSVLSALGVWIVVRSARKRS